MADCSISRVLCENILFLKNSNLSFGNLYNERIHLIDSGKKILANNFIFHLNNSFLTIRIQHQSLS